MGSGACVLACMVCEHDGGGLRLCLYMCIGSAPAVSGTVMWRTHELNRGHKVAHVGTKPLLIQNIMMQYVARAGDGRRLSAWS